MIKILFLLNLGFIFLSLKVYNKGGQGPTLSIRQLSFNNKKNKK